MAQNNFQIIQTFSKLRENRTNKIKMNFFGEKLYSCPVLHIPQQIEGDGGDGGDGGEK